MWHVYSNFVWITITMQWFPLILNGKSTDKALFCLYEEIYFMLLILLITNCESKLIVNWVSCYIPSVYTANLMWFDIIHWIQFSLLTSSDIVQRNLISQVRRSRGHINKVLLNCSYVGR